MVANGVRGLLLHIYHIFLSYLLLFRIPSSQSFTHWFLEEGKIHYEPDSLYRLHTPGDLALFISQSKAADELRILEKKSQELLKQQNILQQLEVEQHNKERLLILSDPDCKISKKKLSNFNLHLSSFLRIDVKEIWFEDYLDYKEPMPCNTEDFKVPVCNSEFLFSMKSYDHLKGVADRAKLHGTPEIGLVNPIPQAKNIEDFGHRIHQALAKNETNWVLLNFAAIYWRIIGTPYNAVECLRRALHYSPMDHKDLALVSLAIVLHRAKYSLDAAILMHAALEKTSDYDIVYFTLGNIYGEKGASQDVDVKNQALGQYDLADICYKYVTELQPSFEAARLRWHAARCEQKITGSYYDTEEGILKQDMEDIEQLSVKQQLMEKKQRAHQKQKVSEQSLHVLLPTAASETEENQLKSEL